MRRGDVRRGNRLDSQADGARAVTDGLPGIGDQIDQDLLYLVRVRADDRARGGKSVSRASSSAGRPGAGAGSGGRPRKDRAAHVAGSVRDRSASGRSPPPPCGPPAWLRSGLPEPIRARGRSSMASSRFPITTWSWLLKWWAMAPAMRPRLSAFWSCRRRASASASVASTRLRSLMSFSVIRHSPFCVRAACRCAQNRDAVGARHPHVPGMPRPLLVEVRALKHGRCPGRRGGQSR